MRTPHAKTIAAPPAPPVSVLATGVIFGAVLGLGDLVVARGSGMSPGSMALVLFLDMIGGLVVVVLGLGASLIARWTAHRIGRLGLRPALDALCLSLFALPVTSAMFSGHGVRSTWLGKIGPVAGPLLVWIAGFALFRAVYGA